MTRAWWKRRRRDRQAEAIARAEILDALTTEERLARMAARPGESARERGRLEPPPKGSR